MRVAFLANHYLDPDNCGSWSGLPYFMRRCLEQVGIETVSIFPEEDRSVRMLARTLYWRVFHRKRFLRYCDINLLRRQARQFERRLASLTVDAVFSPSTWPLAFLRTELPAVFWTDATFSGVLNFDASFTNLAPVSIANGHAVDQLALDRCARAVYSSDWAADTAVQTYRVPPAKVRVVPFGGNVQDPPSLESVREVIRRKPLSPCRLLMVGIDWRRKGAEIAVEAATQLNAWGIECRLTIVGCIPPTGSSVPPFVEIIPFLRKSNGDDRRRLAELYAQSHFFVMPSRAEAFGLVFAEASAFGVPCLATEVGGLPTVIHPGVNGALFPLDARGENYAAWIRDAIADGGSYRRLALRSAEDAANRLTWDVAGRQMSALFGEIRAESGC